MIYTIMYIVFIVIILLGHRKPFIEVIQFRLYYITNIYYKVLYWERSATQDLNIISQITIYTNWY